MLLPRGLSAANRGVNVCAAEEVVLRGTGKPAYVVVGLERCEQSLQVGACAGKRGTSETPLCALGIPCMPVLLIYRRMYLRGV